MAHVRKEDRPKIKRRDHFHMWILVTCCLLQTLLLLPLGGIPGLFCIPCSGLVTTFILHNGGLRLSCRDAVRSSRRSVSSPSTDNFCISSQKNLSRHTRQCSTDSCPQPRVRHIDHGSLRGYRDSVRTNKPVCINIPLLLHRQSIGFMSSCLLLSYPVHLPNPISTQIQPRKMDLRVVREATRQGTASRRPRCGDCEGLRPGALDERDHGHQD